MPKGAYRKDGEGARRFVILSCLHHMIFSSGHSPKLGRKEPQLWCFRCGELRDAVAVDLSEDEFKSWQEDQEEIDFTRSEYSPSRAM